jgi:hypothetical protein
MAMIDPQSPGALLAQRPGANGFDPFGISVKGAEVGLPWLL